MSTAYFYVIDGKRHGPAALEQLRSLAARGDLKRQHKVWCKGMDGWKTAASIPELCDDLPPDLDPQNESLTPPPLEPEPALEAEKPMPVCATPGRKQRSPGLMALASLILPGLGQLICGQDAKGLLLIFISIGANFMTSGVSSIILCPLMSIDAYSIAKKGNAGPIAKWEFFPSVPSINKLAPYAVPAAIVSLVLVLMILVKLAQKSEQDARLQQNQERFLQILEGAKDQRSD